MKIIRIVFILMLGALNAQVGINTKNPHPSSILDIKTDKDKKTVTFPRVFLKSETDKNVIYGSEPAHGLVVYNLNPNIKEGKGIYWWDENYQKWLAIINQESISYYANLVQYKVSQSEEKIDMTNFPYQGEQDYTKGELIANGWTEVKGVKMDFIIDKERNNARITFTGSIGLSRISPQTELQDLSIAYGVFIDDRLVESRADMVMLRDYCGLHTFYVNAVVENIKEGNHNVKFAIKKRERSNKSEQNGFVVGGDATYVYDNGYDNPTYEQCGKINTFEAHPSATLHIVQKP